MAPENEELLHALPILVFAFGEYLFPFKTKYSKSCQAREFLHKIMSYYLTNTITIV